MISLDRGAEQLRVRIFGAAVLLVGLVSFGHFSATHATVAHLVGSVAVAAYALFVMHRALGFDLRDLFRCFAPAAAIAIATALLILATETLRAGDAPEWELIATIVALAGLWLVALSGCLWRGALVLPKP